jgi:hypothetical protein
MSEFKVGDKVKINWPWHCAYGKIGTIVKKYHDNIWVIKIPGFDGHAGSIFDGTEDKWNFLEENLIKLPTEKKTKSMKIEVKQTKKTEKPKEITYPCFRKSSNGNELIVLFFEETKGIVVDPGTQAYWKSGQYYDFWCDFFKAPLQNYSATISSQP